jgi:hypothetical protein
MITSLRAWPLILAGVGGLAGCQDYLFEQKFPEKVKEATIVRPAAKPTPADILFVVDNSGSMADEQDNLARNFEAFISQIAGAGDYQIGVVTTDTTIGGGMDPGERAGLLISTFSPSPPNYLISLDDNSCTSAGIPHACFRGPDAAKRVISSALIPNAQDQVTAFQNNVRVGSCGSGEEQGLKALQLALERTAPGQCNEGFLRQGANLVIVIVSDEQDTDNTLIDQYVVEVGRYKDFSKIRLALVVGAVNGEGSDCRIPNNGECGSTCDTLPGPGSGNACTSSNMCPNGEFCNMNNVCDRIERQNITFCNWCSYYNTPDCCSALNGSRYVEFARKMEARINSSVPSIPIQLCRGEMEGVPVACLIDSICQDNFSATLERIARELVITNIYTLDPPAVYPEGVVVKVKNGRFPADGKQLVYNTDFVVIDDGKTLQIMGENTPREGEDVEIFFVVEVEK